MALTFQDVYANAAKCSDHPIDLGIDAEKVETLIAAGRCNDHSLNVDYDTCGSCDTESFAIGYLPDGRFVIAEESSDSSGHG
jgi:hypothetical protein